MKNGPMIAAALLLVLAVVLLANFMGGPAPLPTQPEDTPELQNTATADPDFPQMQRAVAAGDLEPGEAVDVTIKISYTGQEPILALAIEESLPIGWRFLGVNGGAEPDIIPNRDTTGTLNFVWIQVPELPLEFTYQATPDTTAAAANFTGKLILRRTGGEEQSGLVVTDL